MYSYYGPFAQQVNSCTKISDDVKSYLFELMDKKSKEDAFSKPMPWIGMYIALASLFCILAMVADLLHAFRSRKLWFPCKYFTLNAASVTLIAVAMKLPVDLSNPMEGDLDQIAKIGSMAFMCTMMANLMPSIATMDKMELLTNIAGLGFLVITMIINVCIQIYTGVVEAYPYAEIYGGFYGNRIIATIYVAMLLMLLIIQTCSALMIPKSKQILESKYQTRHQIALQQPTRLTVEKLKQHVTNHWIMAGTGNPQFITTCSATTSASGVICVFSTIFLFVVVINNYRKGTIKYYESDYKWSIPVILITQSLGVVLGTVAPLCRCFAALSLKLSIKWIQNNFKVFRVESYWTQMLCDWKESGTPFSISNHKSKIVMHYVKILILSFCIRFQITVVVACKIIALIPMFLVICISFLIDHWDHIRAKFSAPSNVSRRNPEQLKNNQDCRLYVLQLEDDMEVADRTLDNITKSLNRLFSKAKKQKPNQLIKLLQKFEDFKGLRKYSHFLHTSRAEEHHHSWSLSLVTLTTITISLINFQKEEVDKLLSSVSEGLEYVTCVEESLNATNEYVSSQKAAKSLWIEVECSQEWLQNKLKNAISEQNSTKQVLEWFRNTAKNIADIEVSNENLVSRSMCASSMYYISESLLRCHQDHINEVTRQKLFEELRVLIADILASCITNIPQVIVMKCHTNVIKKREENIYATTQLLGKTMQIINCFQNHNISRFYPDNLAFFDEWCDHFHQSIP